MTNNAHLIDGAIVRVVLPFNSDGYDYIAPSGSGISIGDIVRAPFRNGVEIGVVWERVVGPLDYPMSKVKTLSGRVDTPRLGERMRDFVQKVAAYNMASLGNVLRMVIGGKELFRELKRPRKPTEPLDFSYTAPAFSDEQATAAETIAERIGRGYSCTLLDGITGSGKTEVYFNAVARAMEKNPDGQILVLLPEIALTSQFIDKFRARFGAAPTLWHSNLTPAQKRDAWHAVANVKAKLIVGTRSALFLPYKSLSLIVLDEEHDSSFKQEDQVIYHGRDMAVLKASIEKIPIVLASATPSIETIANVESGKYGVVRLRQRFAEATLPDITLIDMRLDKPSGNRWISEVLSQKILRTLDDGNQAMLYINRRGYAPLALCGACGHRLECPNCSVYLASHDARGERLQCHYCGHAERLPEICPQCGKREWVLCGPGIERIQEEVKVRFPKAKTISISSDTLTSQTRLGEIIASIERKEVDIIIGTQIVVKGHHFPNLTLVGVIDGDMGFAGGDLRANENTFQVLTQVSGRSGRGAEKGEVAIQTYSPENPVMRAIAANDRDAFYAREIAERKAVGMPPYSTLASVLVSSANAAGLADYIMRLARAMPVGIEGVLCFGPVDAPLAMIQKQHRKRFLFSVKKGEKTPKIQDIIAKWLKLAGEAPSHVRLKIDIDPYSFG